MSRRDALKMLGLSVAGMTLATTGLGTLTSCSGKARTKRIVFFFSGTGNSLYVARQIAGEVDDVSTVTVPVIGRVAAGQPILSEQNIEDTMPIPSRFVGTGNNFILTVHGDSMINAGINDGDLVVVRQQNTADYNQIVVALMDDEATLKRYRPAPGHVVLHPENPNFDDIVVDECVIQGVAVKVIKDLL